uniref:Uncharacterized protein n=1 Tax=Knipowitschia caucasica TaxID=637954 RepID=A0AAV2KXJ6_KNICA
MVPEAWTSEPSEPSETSETSERASVASSIRSTTAMHPELSGLSERSQKIVKEWGFSEAHTARLMLRRAQKMKPTQNQHQRHNVAEEQERERRRFRLTGGSGGGTEGNRRFLPKLSSHIVNGGRVQLVTHRSGVRLESRSCPGLSSASTTRAEVLGPKRVSSAPSPKERISFRDKRLQQSTGWGSGKRTKPGLNQD